MAIRAGISIDRRAHRAGNAGQRFQSAQSARDGEIDQILQHRAGVGLHAPVRRRAVVAPR